MNSIIERGTMNDAVNSPIKLQMDHKIADALLEILVTFLLERSWADTDSLFLSKRSFCV